LCSRLSAGSAVWDSFRCWSARSASCPMSSALWPACTWARTPKRALPSSRAAVRVGLRLLRHLAVADCTVRRSRGPVCDAGRLDGATLCRRRRRSPHPTSEVRARLGACRRSLAGEVPAPVGPPVAPPRAPGEPDPSWLQDRRPDLRMDSPVNAVPAGRETKLTGPSSLCASVIGPAGLRRIATWLASEGRPKGGPLAWSGSSTVVHRVQAHGAGGATSPHSVAGDLLGGRRLETLRAPGC